MSTESDPGKVSILNVPAGTSTEFQVYGAAGHTVEYSLWGCTDGTDAVFAASRLIGGSVTSLIFVHADGSYDAVPCPAFTQRPQAVYGAGKVVIFPAADAGNSPQCYDLATSTWTTWTYSGTYGGWRQAVFLNGYFYAWSDYRYGQTAGLYKYDPATGTKTTVGSFVNPANNLNLQAAIIGNSAFWPLNVSGGSVCEFDADTDTITLHSTLGVGFIYGLAAGSDGKLYGANFAGTQVYSWDPSTGIATADATGLTADNSCYMSFAAAGKIAHTYGYP